MKYEKVTPGIRWAQLFIKDMPHQLRFDRWQEWKSKTEAEGERGVEAVRYWAKDNLDECCGGCKHQKEDWCSLQGLPCNVNPILTISEGIIGMACMGLGREPIAEQQTLFQ